MPEVKQTGYSFNVQRSFQHECDLSLHLFAWYRQRVIEELENVDGISIGLRNINSIQHFNEIVFLADSEEKFQSIGKQNAVELSELRKRSKINSKTETMRVTKRRQR